MLPSICFVVWIYFMNYSPWRIRIWCSDTKGLLFTAELTGTGLVSLTMPFNQHSGAIYLKSKLYSAVEIASDVVTEHGCQVCVLSPTAGSVDSPHAPTCWPRTARASASEQPRVRSVLFITHWIDFDIEIRSQGDGKWGWTRWFPFIVMKKHADIGCFETSVKINTLSLAPNCVIRETELRPSAH